MGELKSRVATSAMGNGRTIAPAVPIRCQLMRVWIALIAVMMSCLLDSPSLGAETEGAREPGGRSGTMEATAGEIEESIRIAARLPTPSDEQIRKVASRVSKRPAGRRTDADYLVLSVASSRRDDHDRSLQYAMAGLSMPSSHDRIRAGLLFRKALAYQEFGLLELSLVAFDEAAVADPTFSWPHSGRADSLYRLKRYQESLSAADLAIRLNPSAPNAHKERGNVLSSLGKDKQALAEHDRAVALKPDYVAGNAARGNVLSNLGRFEEALAAHDRTLKIDPDFAYSHVGRGRALQELGRYGEALAAYDRGIELDPKDHYPHAGRGGTLFSLKRYKESLVAYDAAIDLNPKDSFSHSGRGYALFTLGKMASALSAFDRAVGLDPNNADSRHNRLQAYERLCR